MKQIWTVKIADDAVVHDVQLASGLGFPAARTLVARGIDTASKVEHYLTPSLDRDWLDPTEIPGMIDAVNVIEAAIRAGKRIMVFGDFDLDGISATALLVRGLKALGSHVDYLIPNRIDEGYGLTSAVLKRIFAVGPELLITVDCGISSAVEVELILAQGIDVVITDHHEPSGSVPENVPVANPKLQQNSPETILAGAGVALKLVAALGIRFNQTYLWRDLVDLATLGTIADIMPLTGENRALVAEGIQRINSTPRPGIAASLTMARKETTPVTATDLSFSLIPRLNAAGRMGDATAALELLLSDQPLSAHSNAQQLEELNQLRRNVEATLSEAAMLQAEAGYHGQNVLILAGEGWHEGVKGIVASRIAKRFGVPTIIFSIEGDEARGSGRSVGSVNLFAAVQHCADLTLRFGGHEAAVGVTVPRAGLDAFRLKMEQILSAEPIESFHPALEVDAVLKMAEISLEGVEQLDKLEPYGQENRQPLFATSNVFFKSSRAVGVAKNHLSCMITDGRNDISGVFFHCPDLQELLGYTGPITVLYNLHIDGWNGRRQPKMQIKLIERLQVEPEVAGYDYAEDSTVTEEVAEEGRLHGFRESWQTLAGDGMEVLTDALRAQFIGSENRLREAQAISLMHLANSESVLTVMATGCGKSLVFQIHAARLALLQRKASLFIFPLRALISDQASHLEEKYAAIGLKVAVITGESSFEHRVAVFAGLAKGTVDILLTTPEFLQLHAHRFRESGRIGFLVIDEAHHIALDRAGHRPAYQRFADIRQQFSEATVLAVTATADEHVAKTIITALGITRTVFDSTSRGNLLVVDCRNTRDRETYLASLVSQAEKTIVYVNSREQSISLTRMLRKRLPATGTKIAFYNAGLTREDRKNIETRFRNGELRTIVSTSAFGEGVDIPDIRQIVLFHLPFNEVGFNQMSGRAGRDGKPAAITLLYGREDASINDRLLVSNAPSRADLVTLYRVLTQKGQHVGSRLTDESQESTVTQISDADLARACAQTNRQCRLDERGVSAAIAIFEEMGLLTIRGDATARILEVTRIAERVELSTSSRYLEGIEELLLFEEFKKWALNAPEVELATRVNNPILPNRQL